MIKQVSKITNYEFSETGNFVDITTRLSYMDDYNYNGFCLRTSKDENKTKKCVESLINTPVVAYYNVNTDDFEGHNVVMTVDGIKFNTSAIGTHIEAWIQNEKVKPVFSNEEVELPCIYGKARIWASRFPEYYAVLKKRLKNNEMYTSWELEPESVKKEKVENSEIPNPRSTEEWEFLGDCLLGSSFPAYGENSKVLEMSSFDMELSEALSKDIMSLSNKQNKDNEDNNIDDTEKNEGGSDCMSKAIKHETSGLSSNNLYDKIFNLINSISDSKWYGIAMLYPYDYKVIAYDYERLSDEDYVEFNYSITSDNVIINSQKEVKMIFMPKDTYEAEKAEYENKISEIRKEFKESSEAVVELTTQKEELETQIKELSEYKIKFEEMEKAEQEKELAEKKEELKTFTLENDLIESSELESNEQIINIFAELSLDNYEDSKEKIKYIKYERAFNKLQASKVKDKNITETSEKVEKEIKGIAKINDETEINPTLIMSAWLNSK